MAAAACAIMPVVGRSARPWPKQIRKPLLVCVLLHSRHPLPAHAMQCVMRPHECAKTVIVRPTSPPIVSAPAPVKSRRHCCNPGGTAAAHMQTASAALMQPLEAVRTPNTHMHTAMRARSQRHSLRHCYCAGRAQINTCTPSSWAGPSQAWDRSAWPSPASRHGCLLQAASARRRCCSCSSAVALVAAAPATAAFIIAQRLQAASSSSGSSSTGTDGFAGSAGALAWCCSSAAGGLAPGCWLLLHACMPRR